MITTVTSLTRVMGLALMLAMPQFFTTSCTTRELPAAEAVLAIPELKARPAGLSPLEFTSYRARYEELKQKLLLQPENLEARVELAQLFANEARISGDHPYYYPAAKAMIEYVLARDPEHFLALVTLGSIQLSLHQFSQAVVTGQKALRVSPHSHYPWGILCDASLELGDYAMAVRAADSMVSIRPDLRSYARVSYLREIHGDVDGAIEAMIMAVKAGAAGREEKAWARTTLGAMYLNHGKLSQADAEYRTALAERPNYAFALAGLARIEYANSRTNNALRLLDSASALVPEFSFAQLKADILRAEGRLPEEAQILRQIEDMLAEDVASGHTMDREFAMLYATRGINVNVAKDYARKELAKRPNNIEAKYTMALAHFRSGELADAQAIMHTLTSPKSSNAEHLALAGLIAESRGENEAAKRYLTQALEVTPYLTPWLRAEVSAAVSRSM